MEVIWGLYGDNGKENGNYYYNGVYMLSSVLLIDDLFLR